MWEMESIIRLVCIAHQKNCWRRGRTVERLGIKHLSISELTRYVTGTSKHQMPIQACHPKLEPLSVTRVEQERKTNGRERIGKSLPAEVAAYSETSTTTN